MAISQVNTIRRMYVQGNLHLIDAQDTHQPEFFI